MTVSDKAREKLDEASKEIKEAIDNLKEEVAELGNKVKEKLRGAGQEMRESAEELTQEVKTLSEKVRDLIPKRRKKGQLPVSVDRSSEFRPDTAEYPFLELRRAMDRLYDDFFRSYRWPLTGRQFPWGLKRDFSGTEWPPVDMNETDEELKITAELPGVDKDNIDILLTDDRITISGEKKEQEERKGRGYYTLERSYGSFQRSFYLPCKVESNKAEASFGDGVLTLKLPKSTTALDKGKKIHVRAG
ncbi:MAG: Hsp20 family protein [Thermodesulfobacteriota bacterium]|nr:Hsp20 family protein [Thermodesulfobacteriota bacterium]